MDVPGGCSCSTDGACYQWIAGVATTISVLGMAITHSSGQITQYLIGSGRVARFMEILSPLVVLALGIPMMFQAAAH